MTERQSKKKKEKEPIEKTHPKGCSCPKCLDRKISAIAVILNEEMQLINAGMIQLENELNQTKLIQKRIFDFLKEHHRAELLPDNSAIVKRKRRFIIPKKLHPVLSMMAIFAWSYVWIATLFEQEGMFWSILAALVMVYMMRKFWRESWPEPKPEEESSPEQQQEAAPEEEPEETSLQLRDDFWEGDEVKRPIFKEVKKPKKVVDPPAPDPEGEVVIYPCIKPDKIKPPKRLGGWTLWKNPKKRHESYIKKCLRKAFGLKRRDLKVPKEEIIDHGGFITAPLPKEPMPMSKEPPEE